MIAFFSFNLIVYSQGNVVVNGSIYPEVGMPTSFQLNYNPPSPLPNNVSTYKVVEWWIYCPFANASDVIDGYVGNSSNGSAYYMENNPNGLANPKNFIIQWGDNGPVTDYVEGRALVVFYDSSGNFIEQSYTQWYRKDVTIRRIDTPSFTGVNSVLNCSQDTFAQTVTAGEANNFTWSISGGSGDGSVYAGQGTNQVILIPPTSGNFQVKVIAKRTQSNPAYFKENTKNFTRSNRVVSYTVVPITISGITFTPDYMCKSEGREVEMDDDAYITGISWNAPNCTVTSQGIVNGKQKFLIMPNSSIPNGNQVQVSATATYQGGCSATSSSKSFYVYESATPPLPSGYIYMTPIGSNNVCDAEGFEVHFSNPYTNGVTTITPAILPPHAGSSPRQFQVCYINRCSGVKVCKSITGYPPAPCDNFKSATTSLFSLYPNPNKGAFGIQFNTIETGTLVVYDFYGNKMMSQSFKGSITVSVESYKSLKQGIYFIEVNTATKTEKQKFIVN